MRTTPNGGFVGWVASGIARLTFGVGLLLLAAGPAEAQLRASYSYGEGISPAFEGWQRNEDGSYDIVFGYMNRNWLEELSIPVGPDNYFALTGVGELTDLEKSAYDPATADMGQPSYFLPRRNRFTFTARVPASFAEGGQELVWTITANGSTERAYGTLARDYMIDNIVIMSETGALGAGSSSPEIRANQPPVITLEGERVRTVRVGQPVTLVASVLDETPLRRRGGGGGGGSAADSAATSAELLERALSPPRRSTVSKVTGLYFAWFVYRGPGEVRFDPPQVKTWEDTRVFANSPWAPFWSPPPVPEGNRWVTQVTFTQPGTYILRGRADDGGLFADEEITITVVEPLT
jgi:hypothetical protein